MPGKGLRRLPARKSNRRLFEDRADRVPGYPLPLLEKAYSSAVYRDGFYKADFEHQTRDSQNPVHSTRRHDDMWIFVLAVKPPPHSVCENGRAKNAVFSLAASRDGVPW